MSRRIAADRQIEAKYQKYCAQNGLDENEISSATNFYISQLNLEEKSAQLNKTIREIVYSAIIFYLQNQKLSEYQETTRPFANYPSQLIIAQDLALQVMNSYAMGKIAEVIAQKVYEKLPSYRDIQAKLSNFIRGLSNISSSKIMAAAASIFAGSAQAQVTQDSAGRFIYDFPANFNGTTTIQAPSTASTAAMIKINGEVFEGNALPRQYADNVWSLNGYDLTRIGNDLIITKAGVAASSSNNITIKNFNFNANNNLLGISLNKDANSQTLAAGSISCNAIGNRCFPLKDRRGRFVYLTKQTVNGNIILSANICNSLGIPVSSQVLATIPVSNAGAFSSENDIITSGQAAQLPNGTVLFEFAVKQISRNAAGSIAATPASISYVSVAAISADGMAFNVGNIISNAVRSTSGFIYSPSNIVLNTLSNRMLATFTGTSISGLTRQNNVEFSYIDGKVQPVSTISSGLEVVGFGAQSALSQFKLDSGDIVSVAQGSLSFSKPQLVPATNKTVDILVDQKLAQYFLPQTNCSVSVSAAVDSDIPEIIIPNTAGATYMINMNGVDAKLNLRDLGLTTSSIGQYLREAEESDILPQDFLNKGAISQTPSIAANIMAIANSSQTSLNPRYCVIALPNNQKIIINGFTGFEVQQNLTKFFADTQIILPQPSSSIKDRAEISGGSLSDLGPQSSLYSSSANALDLSDLLPQPSRTIDSDYSILPPISSTKAPELSSGSYEYPSSSFAEPYLSSNSYAPISLSSTYENEYAFPSSSFAEQSSANQDSSTIAELFSSDDNFSEPSYYSYSSPQSEAAQAFSDRASSIYKSSSNSDLPEPSPTLLAQSDSSQNFAQQSQSSSWQSPEVLTSVAVSFLSASLSEVEKKVGDSISSLAQYVESMMQKAQSQGLSSQLVEETLRSMSSSYDNSQTSSYSSSFAPAASQTPIVDFGKNSGSDSQDNTNIYIGVAAGVASLLLAGIAIWRYNKHKKQTVQINADADISRTASASSVLMNNFLDEEGPDAGEKDGTGYVHETSIGTKDLGLPRTRGVQNLSSTKAAGFKSGSRES